MQPCEYYTSTTISLTCIARSYFSSCCAQVHALSLMCKNKNIMSGNLFETITQCTWMALIKTKHLSVYSSGNQWQHQIGTVCPLCPIHKLFEDQALKKIKAASKMTQGVKAFAYMPEPRLNLWNSHKGGRREVTPQKLSSNPCTCTVAHAYTSIKLQYTKPSPA